ncbi:hypothetical protein F0249_19215 [Vibrio sp. 03-59-1]|nr:hypothetical protein [Vibrio sp. 03-59-1]NOH85920.1 hypothetical protein [Vibrio sp. 03-59-1]
MQNPSFDPIHLPCPDMAGCVNPSPEKTQKSLSMVAKLRARFAKDFQKSKAPFDASNWRGLA